MKKILFLGLLLFSSITTWAQNPDPLVQFSCPELPHVSQAARQQGNSIPPKVFPAPLIANRPSPTPGPVQPSCPGVINVNIHFMLRLDGTGNFNETDDGAAYKPWNANGPQDPSIPADTANNGYARARALVSDMNGQAASNPLNGYPAGTASSPKGYSYALNGVYFHRVSQSEYESVKNDYNNISTAAPFDNYGVNKASEINLILMGNYTNGSCCDVGGVACSLGYNPNTPTSYWAKLFNSHEMYRWRQENNGNTISINGAPYTIPQNSLYLTSNPLGHEIGHLLGLQHSFGGANGCADADAPGRGSSGNNLMDYVSGTALTDCQLGIVNANLYNSVTPANSYYNYLSNSTCNEVPPRAFFAMYPCLSEGSVCMDSRGTFMADQMTVTIYAYNATATTGRGTLLATYRSNSSRGGRWNLASIYRFVTGQQYYVELTASRTSGQSHTLGQIIRIYSAFEGPCGPMQAPAQP